MGVGPNYQKKNERRSWSSSGLPKVSSDNYSYNSTSITRKLPNPDPNNYQIIQAEEIGNFLVLRIKYPDCTNYEGTKILVFKDVKAIDLLKQKLIDPHFFEDKKYKSPVARFVPTNEGWQMAIDFAKSYGNTRK